MEPTTEHERLLQKAFDELFEAYAELSYVSDTPIDLLHKHRWLYQKKES